ncbi:hypothetical protein AB0L13_40190 [Saccharopolyspora shandongensis]|uniref:hypothetical protein n=1 Tax=Saccharopolyspora shandongensis TaxID=418495 RepID=UPI0034231F8C
MVDKSKDWINSDAWKQDPNTNWSKLDYYVNQGYMTPEERDLCRAYESLVYSDQPTGSWENGEYRGDYKAANDAWVKFGKVEDEHRDDKVFDKDNPDLPPPKYNEKGPDGTYKPPPIEVPPPPKVPGDSGDGKFKGPGKIAVNTQALKTFADNLDKIREDLLKPAKGKVKDLDVKPGGFKLAYDLRHSITTGSGNTDKGLKTDLDQYTGDLDIQLANIRDEVRKLVTDYNNTEDLNKLGADKLNSIMTESFSYIDGGSKKPGS